jgi:hypothetical protein
VLAGSSSIKERDLMLGHVNAPCDKCGFHSSPNGSGVMTIETALDPAVGADPYVFCLGFMLTAVGLMLSQIHRDEGFTPWSTGLGFNLLRKASGAEMIVGSVLGFWVVGTWWLLWLPGIVLISPLPVNALRGATNRLPITIALMACGLSLVVWAQGPSLNRLGLLPSLQ